MNSQEAAEHAQMATPHKQLIDELLDSRIPKSEREHAAAREIERLRQALVEPEQKPAAYVTGYFDGKCVIRPLEQVLLPTGMALYQLPPKRDPLTEQQILDLLPLKQNYWTEAETGLWIARVIERAHGIGGEE